MDARLRVALPAALLLSLALAGCMGGPHFESAGVDEVSARENLDLATRAAHGWDAHARLVGVAGGENGEGDEDFPADPHVGDGLAVLWTYVFQNNESQTRAFEVSADGTVVSKNESEAIQDYGAFAGGYAAAYQSYRASQTPKGEALADWSVDSDDALDAALDNATFKAAARQANATLAMGLGNTGVPNAWVLAAQGEEATVIAVVNATSGELVTVQDLSRYSYRDAAAAAAASQPTKVKPAATAGRAPRPVDLKDEGTLTATDTVRKLPFYGDAGLTGNLTLTARFQGDAEYLRWAIRDRATDKVVLSGQVGGPLFGGGFPTGTTEKFAVKIKDASMYDLVLELFTAQGAVPLAQADYTLQMKLA